MRRTHKVNKPRRHRETTVTSHSCPSTRSSRYDFPRRYSRDKQLMVQNNTDCQASIDKVAAIKHPLTSSYLGILQCIHRLGLQTLLPPVATFASSDLTSSACDSNFSFNTVNLDRYSSIPIYAPHMRRLPSKADRPCRTR